MLSGIASGRCQYHTAAHLGTLGLYLGTYASAEQAADTIAGSFSSRYMYDEEK